MDGDCLWSVGRGFGGAIWWHYLSLREGGVSSMLISNSDGRRTRLIAKSQSASFSPSWTGHTDRGRALDD